MSNTWTDAEVIVMDRSSIIARDAALVAAAKDGASSAFMELYGFYSRPLFRIALYITKNREDAEDALQDAFLHAYKALKNFREDSTFYTWISRITINSCRMILRKRRLKRETSLQFRSETSDEPELIELPDTAPDPEQIYLRRQKQIKLQGAIQRLAPSLREAAELWGRECSVNDGARLLNISVAATKSRLHRARNRLRNSSVLKDLAS